MKMPKRKFCFIYGTRPEIIKLSPIIKLFQKKKMPFFCIHTGQHYSYNMDKIFLKELNLPAPEYKLYIKSKAPYKQGNHTGRMLIDIESILLKEFPYCVIVQGDTNTTLAGALVVKKISTTEKFTGFDMKVAHVEAGLRSYDRTMPEENNRFIVDHLSDFLFAPTATEKGILLEEGILRSSIYITGNTIADVVKQYIVAANKDRILENFGLMKRGYILLTLHRQENVDSQKTLKGIIKGVVEVQKELRFPVVYPIHPRTAKNIRRFRLKIPKDISIMTPTGFLEFLCLEANAAIIMTDSGGVQEEACILKVPCVTLRNCTERPQTVSVGSNVIAGISPDRIKYAASRIFKTQRNWKNPFGDGKAAERIAGILSG